MATELGRPRASASTTGGRRQWEGGSTWHPLRPSFEFQLCRADKWAEWAICGTGYGIWPKYGIARRAEQRITHNLPITESHGVIKHQGIFPA